MCIAFYDGHIDQGARADIFSRIQKQTRYFARPIFRINNRADPDNAPGQHALSVGGRHGRQRHILMDRVQHVLGHKQMHLKVHMVDHPRDRGVGQYPVARLHIDLDHHPVLGRNDCGSVQFHAAR